jgi:hypothetical protein
VTGEVGVAEGVGAAQADSRPTRHNRLYNLKSLDLLERGMNQFLIYDTISPIIPVIGLERQVGEGLYRDGST